MEAYLGEYTKFVLQFHVMIDLLHSSSIISYTAIQYMREATHVYLVIMIIVL